MKIWTRSEIDSLLRTNDRAVERAMVVLYDRQTRDEKASNDTRHLNNRGFSCTTVKKGTYYARWVLGGRQLTGFHLDRARKIALWHSKQLVEEANDKSTSDAG